MNPAYFALQASVLQLPLQRTWAPGETPSADELNINVRDSVNWLLSPPRALVYSSAPQNFSTAISDRDIRPLVMDTVQADTDEIWSQDFPSRFYITTPGLYRVRVEEHWAYSSSRGSYQCGIAKNSFGVWPLQGSTNRVAEDTRTGSNNAYFGTSLGIRATILLLAGEYVEFFTAQTTGADLQLFGGTFGCVGSVRMVALI